ncbi:hypothetical protein GCM10027043_04950 [Ferruginibacter profundus]
MGSCYNSKPVFFDSGKAGEQLVYSYTSEGTGYSDIQMLYNTDSTVKAQPFFFRSSVQVIGVNIQCNIKKTILGASGDSMHVCFELIQPYVKIENSTLPVDAGMIIKEMALPVFADMTIAGNILSVKTDTAVSYLTAGIVKNILSNTQAVFLHGAKNSWQVTEENTVGLFKADYKVVHQGKDSVEYTKINTGFIKIKSAKKGQKLLPDSKTTIVTTTSGTVQRIQTSESIVTLFGADTIVASGSSMEYKLLSVRTIGQQDISAFKQLEHSGRYLAPVALSDPISDEEINRLAYKNTLAEDNLETLMLKMRVMKMHDKEYENDLAKKFRALAWLSEKDCIKMAAVLKDAAPGSGMFRVISRAMAAVETSFSINELALIIAERGNDEAVMTELLPVLATTPTPTGMAADIVKELAFTKRTNAFITTTAQLTLGGMIKNLAHTDKQKADELTDVVVENMKNSQDTLQQLLVYGNTGAYRLLPAFASYISSPLVSAEIRKAAVFATRLIDNEEVTLLLGKLSVDKDTVISKTAKETIEFRSQYLNRNL